MSLSSTSVEYNNNIYHLYDTYRRPAQYSLNPVNPQQKYSSSSDLMDSHKRYAHSFSRNSISGHEKFGSKPRLDYRHSSFDEAYASRTQLSPIRHTTNLVSPRYSKAVPYANSRQMYYRNPPSQSFYNTQLPPRHYPKHNSQGSFFNLIIPQRVPVYNFTFKQQRRRHNKSEIEILEAAFAVNSLPSKEEKQRICNLTGLTQKNVQIWFQNKRQAVKRKNSEMEKKSQSPNHYSHTSSFQSRHQDSNSELNREFKFNHISTSNSLTSPSEHSYSSSLRNNAPRNEKVSPVNTRSINSMHSTPYLETHEYSISSKPEPTTLSLPNKNSTEIKPMSYSADNVEHSNKHKSYTDDFSKYSSVRPSPSTAKSYFGSEKIGCDSPIIRSMRSSIDHFEPSYPPRNSGHNGILGRDIAETSIEPCYKSNYHSLRGKNDYFMEHQDYSYHASVDEYNYGYDLQSAPPRTDGLGDNNNNNKSFPVKHLSYGHKLKDIYKNSTPISDFRSPESVMETKIEKDRNPVSNSQHCFTEENQMIREERLELPPIRAAFPQIFK
ncbi:hypothetical protein BB560_002558 [Smittium megazygosporum]|uniref:Homeobox domain-containing protein n=1 Tax=Smittium megazygosporum TaxID=133381 RepID=A0A2T9ZEJ4_9FUNG|nr:hypothetical protein BB560_002558 [Smittium megazygosporum]